jgi:hypothetical protein
MFLPSLSVTFSSTTTTEAGVHIDNTGTTDSFYSFLYSILLGFSRVIRSYARLTGLADSRRVTGTLFRAAPRHPRE